MQGLGLIIKRLKKEYHSIGLISSPVFKNEKVLFNRYGWNHILRKGRKLRPPQEQLRRINLIPRAVEIIMASDTINGYHASINGKSKMEFWELVGKDAHVIIRRKNNGIRHFFSVF